METPYSIAWSKFVNSPDYKKIHEAVVMGTRPIPTKYFNNIVREAFDAGWNANAEKKK